MGSDVAPELADVRAVVVLQAEGTGLAPRLTTNTTRLHASDDSYGLAGGGPAQGRRAGLLCISAVVRIDHVTEAITATIADTAAEGTLAASETAVWIAGTGPPPCLPQHH